MSKKPSRTLVAVASADPTFTEYVLAPPGVHPIDARVMADTLIREAKLTHPLGFQWQHLEAKFREMGFDIPHYVATTERMP